MPMLTEQLTSIWPLVDYKNLPKLICVYEITHSQSEKKYFGRSSNLKERARKHYQELCKGVHKNPKMQNVHNKYGDQWIIRIIEEFTSIDNSIEFEELLLSMINLKESFNCHTSSTGGSKDQIWTDEQRKRQSEISSGRKHSEESKLKMSKASKESESCKQHLLHLLSPEVRENAVKAAATPEARLKALETRRKNGHKPFSDESRKYKIEVARQKVFDALDWAVENNATRGEAIKKFGSSWGSLKKYLPEWEVINGSLPIPKRASGENSAMFKDGLSAEKRRKKTTEELEQSRKKHSERMSGENNPMYGRTHTEEARKLQSEAAKLQAELRRLSQKE